MKEAKLFRLKDSISGLYYRNVREVVVCHPDGREVGHGYVKSNLSNIGKIYGKMFKLPTQIADPKLAEWESNWNSKRLYPKTKYRAVTWEIEYL